MLASLSLALTVFAANILFIEGAMQWPKFSWDHVPVWIHTCNTSGPWNATTLEYFSKYPIITFEKGQGVFSNTEPYSSLFAEDKIVDACKQIKEIDPSIACLFYYNSINDWTYYELHDKFAENPDWWLRDDYGNIVLIGGDKSFPQPEQGMLVPDYRQEIVGQFWASECLNITMNNPGIVDGCFTDKPQYNNFKGYNFTESELNKYAIGHNESITSIQAGLNKTNASILISNNGWVPEGVVATQLQSFHASEHYLLQLLGFSEKGILVECHAAQSDCTDITDTLSVFLIGANEYSYYACSDGWQWPDNWNVWYPEYDKPLGKPLGKAVKIGSVYSRSFASGTNATFDVSNNTGNIVWAS